MEQSSHDLETINPEDLIDAESLSNLEYAISSCEQRGSSQHDSLNAPEREWPENLALAVGNTVLSCIDRHFSGRFRHFVDDFEGPLPRIEPRRPATGQQATRTIIYNTKSTTRNWYAHLLRRRVELRGAELGARSPSSGALRGPVRERRGPARGDASKRPRAELRRGGETRSSRAPDRRRAARCRVGDIRRRHLSDDRAIAEVERGRSETHVCLA